jgi:hypothetical protein
MIVGKTGDPNLIRGERQDANLIPEGNLDWIPGIPGERLDWIPGIPGRVGINQFSDPKINSSRVKQS